MGPALTVIGLGASLLCIRMQTKERAALVNAHAWIVAQFVARYEGRGNGADLSEAGMLGLCEAAARFRPGKVQFATYAWNWVKGAVLEEIRLAHVVPISKRAALGKTQAPVNTPRFDDIPEEALKPKGQFHNDARTSKADRKIFRMGLFVEGVSELHADEPRRRRIAANRITALSSPDVRRVAFRALKGRTVEQIAQALEMPPGRVIRLLCEAQQQLASEAPADREAA
jgi:RNA polymerase sigma factor (sigma-70 family)